MPGKEFILEIEHISKTYPGARALEDISLGLHSGEILALTGEKKAGKSTLACILAGLVSPDPGGLMSLGRILYTPRSMTEAQERGVAILQQEFNLCANLDVTANVFLGHEMSVGGKAGILSLKEMEARTQALLNRFNAHFTCRTIVDQLSLAQQQLVGIIKTLSFDSQLIILDEPTLALPDDQVQVLFELMREHKQKGCAIIFISSRLEEIFLVADRIAILREGKLASLVKCSETSPAQVMTLIMGRPNPGFPSRVSP